MKLFLLLLFAVSMMFLACNSNSDDGNQLVEHALENQVGLIAERRIDEISGMALSTYDEHVLWVVNDSGDDAALYAVRADGRFLGAVVVKGIHNRDWEDLTTFETDSASYIVISDVGDNDARYGEYFLTFVREPDTRRSLPDSVGAAWRLGFRYADGARDCEAVAVDAENRQIFLLTKRDVPAKLYTLELDPSLPVQIAKPIGTSRRLPQPTPEDIQDWNDRYHAQPTAMDMHPDGRLAVVLTYKNLFLYRRPEAQSWKDTFFAEPKKVTFEELNQAEAMCLAADGRSVFVTTEHVPAPILQIPIE